MIRNGGRYASLILGAGALWWLAHQGVFPEKNPLRPNEHLLWERDLDRHGWADLLNRRDVIICLTFFFITAGPTAVLPNDFNINSNLIFAIGAGFAGSNGFPGNGGFGGDAGGGGAYASISNYSNHTAGQTVNVQVGTSDSWFDSTSILFAQAASGRNGGQAASSVGTTVFNGGNGGHGGTSTGFGGSGGGGGGGAAGPSGAGSNGADGVSNSGSVGVFGGAGGNSDNNSNTGGAGGGAATAGGNGTGGQEFDATHGCGAGGGGGGGSGTGGAPGGNGGNAGAYGGGGGGGGGAGLPSANGGNGGNAFQGLLGIQYTPATATARSYGFIL